VAPEEGPDCRGLSQGTLSRERIEMKNKDWKERFVLKLFSGESKMPTRGRNQTV
jgi:hypothetical protein